MKKSLGLEVMLHNNHFCRIIAVRALYDARTLAHSRARESGRIANLRLGGGIGRVAVPRSWPFVFAAARRQ